MNRLNQLKNMIPELRQHLEDCKGECEEADECGDLEDRIEARYRLNDAEIALRSAMEELRKWNGSDGLDAVASIATDDDYQITHWMPVPEPVEQPNEKLRNAPNAHPSLAPC